MRYAFTTTVKEGKIDERTAARVTSANASRPPDVVASRPRAGVDANVVARQRARTTQTRRDRWRTSSRRDVATAASPPQRRRDPFSRSIHVAAAASPRPVHRISPLPVAFEASPQLISTEYVVAAASPRPVRRTSAPQAEPARRRRYVKYHDEIWPEVCRGLRAAGVNQLTIFRAPGTRTLFMYIVTAGATDMSEATGPGSRYREDPKCKEWEELMDADFHGGWTALDEVHSSDTTWVRATA